jgi:hypothetical protein
LNQDPQVEPAARLWRCALLAITASALLALGGAIAAADEPSESQRQWESAYQREILPIVQSLCLECHSGEAPEGELDLARFSSGEIVSSQLDLWDQVGKRVRGKEMPPEGSPQLNDQQQDAFDRWLDSRPEADDCETLATDETQAWYRGYVMSRRLTRTEYLHAIRDLLGVPTESLPDLPSDGSGGAGFDTAGDALFTSAIHVEQYLSLASAVIDPLVGEVEPQGDDAQAQQVRAARQRLGVPVPGDQVADEAAARTVIAEFARRAWRRTIAAEEIERLLGLYASARQRGASVPVALGEPLKAILVSPHFLFVVESESADGGIQKLSPHQLATRLALFLWSSIPDDELLRAADQGQLETDEQVIAQVRRMLADPKARALGENFGIQWLGLSNFLSSVQPDAEVYPEFDPLLAADMHREATESVYRVFCEDRSVFDLLAAESVYVNGRLARHYGIELAADAPWQRVAVVDGRRGGLLTLAAVLTSTSYPRRTSPVLRGRWVLEELLGDPVPPPPPTAPALDESDSSQAATLRQRLEIHRQDPQCAACHNRMDPLGFGLENYDGLGRWREHDQGSVIDASGVLPSGQTFQGPGELKQVLLQRAGEFEEHLVKKLLSFALGRELNKFDQCVIDDCREKLSAQDHRAALILETIATSYPFQHRFFKAATK